MAKKGMLQEFKDFIASGDLITTAIGLVIALKVKDVIDSFMSGVVNPLIGGIFGKQDFNSLLQFRVGDAVQEDGSTGSLVQPGVILTSFINLVIVGFVLFLILKWYKKMKAASDAPAGPSEVDLLTEIRDTLKAR